LPSLSDLSDVSESSLQDPLPWDAVPAARFQKVNRVQPYLAPLRENSAKRVQADKQFSLLAEAVARVKKTIANKTVSLNEKERRDEIAKSKALEEQLKQESRKLRAGQPLTYEITLANANRPGLPAPTAVPPPEKKPAKAPNAEESDDDLTGDFAGHTPADDIILTECERILADYVKRAETN
jgi:carboxyl-terminal processing protease